MATMAELMAAEARRKAAADAAAALAKRRAELAERERARLYQVSRTGSSAPKPVAPAPPLPTPGSLYVPPSQAPQLIPPSPIETPITATTPLPSTDTLKTEIPKYVLPKYMVPNVGRPFSGTTGPLADNTYGPFRDSAFSTMGPKPTSMPPTGYEWRAKILTMTDGRKRAIWAIEPMSKVSATKTMVDLPAAPASDYSDYYDDYNGGGGGGGGGGDGGGGGTTEVVPPDPLGELSWWATGDSIQPLLRNWASWMRELVEANRLTRPVPNPFVFDQEAEAAYAKLDNEKGPVAPGFRSSKDVLGRLQSLLGLDFTKEENKTEQWQKVVNAVPTAGLEAQQLLTSLRFDPTSERWYSVDTPLLVNEKYI